MFNKTLDLIDPNNSHHSYSDNIDEPYKDTVQWFHCFKLFIIITLQPKQRLDDLNFRGWLSNEQQSLVPKNLDSKLLHYGFFGWTLIEAL